MKRFVRGLGSLVVLLALVAGAPMALLRVGRTDALSGIGLDQLLFVADTGAVLLLALTLVAWVAWFVVAASVIAEVAAVLSRGRIRVRIPGGSWAQPTVSALVLAVAAMVASPVGAATAQSTDRTSSAPVVASATRQPAADPVRPAPTPPAGDEHEDSVHHRVAAGEDLWTIAETWYGDGTRWRSIASANDLDPEAVLPVGIVLRLDGVTSRPTSEPMPEEVAVVVRPGDTLSSLAQEHLGDSARWPEIQAANATRVVDPDVIRPGWRLVLPAVAPEGTALGAAASQGPAATKDPVQRVPTAPAAPVSSAPAQSPADAPASIPHSDPAQQAESAPPTAPGPQAGQTLGAEKTSDSQELDPALAAVAALGTLTAAALSSALVLRRRAQLAQRPVGRRMVLPEPESLHIEAALARTAATASDAPAHATYADVLLGSLDDGSPVLHDLEAAVTTVVVGEPDRVDQVVAAAATGIALQPWSAESGLVVAGRMPWIDALDEPQVQCVEDLERTVVQLERSVAARRVALGRARLAAGGEGSMDEVDLASLREDPDRWDAWAPLLFVLAERPTTTQWGRIERSLSGSPVGISVLAAGAQVAEGTPPHAGEVVEVHGEVASLRGTGVRFTPHLLDATARRALVDLFETTAAARTTPAPWWSHDEDLPPNLTLFNRRRPTTHEDQEAPVDPTAFNHPTLLLLGPVDLQGCRGEAPTRARRQCVEYAAWIQQHPGRTSSQMARELMVAETTRRSNMSRLRNWLGTDPDGQLYLPDAYSGRIELHPAVTSDWEHLQLLIGTGINRTSTDGLVEALGMVRGAPLADAAPGQWHWAEEMRTDMASVARDIGLVLAERALAELDLDLARWAVNRALRAAPGDEPLMRARIRTEHLAGNRPEVERLVLQTTRQARSLGVDLDEETIGLVQEVMEGRRRAQA
ncbi:MAG: LysM peptidoglycan-binding domain-containing protein [Luteococcus sp.]|uniref:LysM peptidoglycan-binding domain-containing protein n=1 Tax=Luteococcus sp. TaxID=1969402 RepID=UPI002648E44E|nr:LysM peptidoglycan-binding domain-containing protein [Luteococcus sp.]MDN5562214.1 LysM peptidoglycan-binding domain-containing protein [Luteococcus sp.]